MNKRNKIASLIFTLYILLSFYVFGAGMVNALVAYRTWRWVGAAEFPRFHQVDSKYIIPVFVIFFALSFIPQVALCRVRPAALPLWLIWAALVCNLVTLISTVTIQIPIQVELDKKFSAILIERLIATDMLFRRIPMLLLAVLNTIMLYKVVTAAQKGDTAVFYKA